MIYRLFSFPGCSRTDIPSFSSWTSLLTACSGTSSGVSGWCVGSETEIAREAWGRDITVTLPVNSQEPIYDQQPTHIAVYLNAYTPKVMYYVTSAERTGQWEGESEYIRFTASLCGVFTAALAEGGYHTSFTEWEFDRYLPGQNDVWQHTTEPIDALTTPISTIKTGTHYAYPAGYSVVITWTAFPSTAVLPANLNQYTVKPISSVIVNSDGVFAIADMTRIVNALGSETDKIYRIQLVPTTLCAALFDYTNVDRQFHIEIASTIYTFACTNTFSYGEISSWLSASIVADNTEDDVINGFGKVVGEPKYECYVLGEKVATIPALPVDSVAFNPHAKLTIALTGTASSGVNVFAKIYYSGVLVGKVSVPTPEIAAVKDGLSTWWEGAKSGIIVSSAMSLVSIASTIFSGGSTLPITAALGASLFQTGFAASQAAKDAKTVGSGSQDLYVADYSLDLFQIRLTVYDSNTRNRRMNYFNKHGYAGNWTFDTLPTTNPRPKFWIAQGRGRCRISPVYLQTVKFTQEDFDAAINEELSQGVRFWHVKAGDINSLINYYPST